MTLDSFKTFLSTAWVNALSWFSIEEQKLASFCYPFFKALKSSVSKDLLEKAIVFVPQIAAAYASGGYTYALSIAQSVLWPLLIAEGTVIEQAVFAQLSNALVSQAQDALARQGTGAVSAAVNAGVHAAVGNTLNNLVAQGAAPTVGSAPAVTAGIPITAGN